MPSLSSKPIVYALDPIHPDAEQIARDHFTLFTSVHPQAAEWRARAEGILARTMPITKEDLAECTHLKFIAKHGVGVDMIDVEACKQKGITLMNTPGINVSKNQTVDNDMYAHRMSYRRKLLQNWP